MNSATIISIIVSYFLLLYVISYFTGKDDSNAVFFKAGKSSKWYIVAFGMVGASLSGVTFISVPGWIESSQFSYLQVVLGYFVGYLVVCYVLLPVYYRLNVTSIYEFLDIRFGKPAHLTGAFYFFISRLLGASFRLFLVAIVLQKFVFDSWNIPFPLTVGLSIALIWVYTYKGGIKTIVWTDTLQTLAMLTAVGVAIYLINQKFGWSFSEFLSSTEFTSKSKIFYFDDPFAKTYFWKYFIGGIFIAITMTGLDQDMMQKNLTCKNNKDAQKNMLTMATLLIVVNFVFLSLGALLFIYAEKFGLNIPVVDGRERTDLLFPEIAMNQNLGTALSVTFIIGLIAAAYSSADSALTSLTTSFSVDFLNIHHKPEAAQKPLRKKVHICVSVVLILVVIIFNMLEGNVVGNLFKFATFTYGPLLGLFAFGILTKFKIKDKLAWIVALVAMIVSFGITLLPESIIGNYKFHWEILPLNGLLTFIGLFLIREKDEFYTNDVN